MVVPNVYRTEKCTQHIVCRSGPSQVFGSGLNNMLNLWCERVAWIGKDNNFVFSMVRNGMVMLVEIGYRGGAPISGSCHQFSLPYAWTKLMHQILTLLYSDQIFFYLYRPGNTKRSPRASVVVIPEAGWAPILCLVWQRLFRNLLC